ncbi:MAG: FMN-binding protein [Acidobacteria bacterium]|nr:FMN-binding protein [Acidobacteriota bacterium]
MLATETTVRLRRVAALGGGLIGIAALAGCTPSAAGGTTGSGAAPAGGSSAASADLKDGSYTATGHYQSPAGDSMVAVTVTLKSGTITAVKVVPKTPNPTAQQYETQFASGVGAVAVGKKISGLQVGAVSGSSLTSQGFEKALAQIQSEAA